jgi:hypothetical protein
MTLRKSGTSRRCKGGCTCTLHVLETVQRVQLHTALGNPFEEYLEVCSVAGKGRSCFLLKHLRCLDCLRHEPWISRPKHPGAGEQSVSGRNKSCAPLQSIELRDRDSAEAIVAAPHSANCGGDGPSS